MLPDSTSALLLLSVLLVHSSVLSCWIGTQRECDAAPFVPGHKMVGKGFDIVRLQIKRAHVINVKTYLNARETCILCSNPLQNHTYQKLPSSVVDWSASSQCSADIISSYHTSVSSLIKAYTSQDTNDWTFGLEIEKALFDNFDVGGTGYNAYKFAKQQIEEDRYTFSTHSVTCNHYDFILSPTPPLSAEFKRQLDILPSHYNYSTRNEYRKLINTYGTHYFRLVELGGRLRRLTSSRSCLSTLNGLTSSEIHSCLSMGVAVGLGKMKISHVPKSCMGVLLNQDSATNFSSGLHQHHSEVLGGDGWLGEFSISQNDSTAYMNWLKSLIEHPEVVSFSFRPLYQLVPNKLQQAGMKTAIEQYLKDTAVKKSLQEPDCEGSTPNLSSDCCPLYASRGNLSVTIVRGWNLYGDVIGKTDGYAKMYYGSISHQTQVIISDEPQWNAEFDLGKVDTSLALKIEVWDQDWKYHDLLIECMKYLSQGTQTFTCKSALGNVEVKYTLTCDPHLTGEKCNLYKPTP
ncbi:perforin-1-like [Xiphophorus couchianus]|uniref:perforin-1-like n=1 Tax=Xiphophorus couchianus TaxID=32473 RepID=UPI001017074F|nr:perforin-1-like [Xiphophorus couchianus]XP_027872720.1 perforin-1-like [Xiphophorus couchianus]